MKKIIYITIIILVIIIITIISFLVSHKSNKTLISIDNIVNAKITYYYEETRKQESKILYITLSNKQIKDLENMMKNYKFEDYSKSGIALDINKEANVKYILSINDKISLMFQPKVKSEEEFILISYNDKEYLSMISKEISEYLYDIIESNLQKDKV